MEAIFDCRTSRETWASDELRFAKLGNIQRVERINSMLISMTERPSGRISETFTTAATRQGAYGIVENTHFDHEQLGASFHAATARRCSTESQVVVAIDGTGLAVCHRGPSFGPVSGKWTRNGAQAMTALAVTLDGVPLGVTAQAYWTRSVNHSPVYAKDHRAIDERETGNWMKTMRHTSRMLAIHAPKTRPWFVLDRGGDCASVIDCAMQLQASLTVRSCYDRVVRGGKLWPMLARARYLGSYPLMVRTATGPRCVTVMVRARPVEMRLRLGVLGKGEVCTPTMWAVEARELGRRKNQIRWRLLTTKPADTFVRAKEVIDTYSLRWRVEEFHKAWKSSVCDIETSWLRKPETFYKWATMSAAVATRIERLKFMSREQPNKPALDEFTQDEIDAVITLRKPKGVKRGDSLTIGEVTYWVAYLGGYIGKSSGGPPGAIVIARGLAQIAPAAIVFASLRNDRPNGD